MSKKTGKNAAHAAVRKAYRMAEAAHRALEKEWGTMPQNTRIYPGLKIYHEAADRALDLWIGQLRRKLGRAAYKRREWVSQLDRLVEYRKSLPR